MNCLKCGREITEGTFCPDCLAVMDRYPVKPNTVVMIPHRANSTVKHPPRRRKEPTEQELLQGARRVIRRLVIACVVLTLLLAAAAVWLILYSKGNTQTLPLGQNYSTATGIQTTETTADVSRETSD